MDGQPDDVGQGGGENLEEQLQTAVFLGQGVWARTIVPGLGRTAGPARSSPTSPDP